MQQHDSMSSHNIISILILAIVGSVILGGAYTSGNNVWMAVLISLVVAIPLLLMYSRIVTLCPGMGIFDVMDKLLGKVVSKIFIVLLTWYALHVGALVMRNFVEYSIAISLFETPRIALMVTMTIASLYLSKSGHKIFGRWASIMCIIVISNLLITTLVSFNFFDFSNMLPLAGHSFSEITQDALTFGAVAFGETVLALSLFGFYKKDGNRKKIYLKALLIGGVVVFLGTTKNLLVLGPHLFSTSNFPSYAASRVISLGNFLERFESIISMNFIFLGVAKISLCMLSASSGMAKLFNISKSKNMVMPAGLLILALCSTFFGSVPEILRFVEVYKYYAIPFQIAIPLIVWITAEVKAKKGMIPGQLKEVSESEE